MPGSGFLAIWSDIEADCETDYLHWLTREHVPERVGVEGFLSGRVFRSVRPNLHRYFILYELVAPEVVASEAYLARLNSPTPWSQRIMPTLGNFVRGGGRAAAEAGCGWGGTIAAIRIDGQGNGDSDPTGLRERVGELAGADRIGAVRLFEVDDEATTIRTREKGMRSRDDSFRTLLLVEGLDRASVEAALASVGAAPGGNEPPLFTAVFALRTDDISGGAS